MRTTPTKGIAAVVAVAACALLGMARAAEPLPAQTNLVSAPNAAAPSQLTFTISSKEDLTITLTDAQAPAALTSAGIVVTQNGAIAASALLAAPAATATATLPAATGVYTLYVFGVPGSGFSVGTFRACVAPKANPSNCIQSASLAGTISTSSSAADPTTSTLFATLTVSTADTYTFTYADLQFPAALNVAPSLAVFQGSTQVALGITSGSILSLSPGTYQLLGIAQADQTIKAGLYGVTITGTTSGATLYNDTVPVGQIAAPATYVNQNSQSVTLKVTDYAFPGALASASSLATLGGTVLGQASASGGASSFTAPAGSLKLWTYGSVGATSGTFSADLSAGSTDLFTVAQGVGPAGSAYAYAFVTPLTAGTYTVAAADLQFPAALTGLSFAVAQGGLILQQSTTAGSVNFTATSGPAVLLVSAQAPVSGGVNGTGLFDVNVQSTGASAQLVFDQTQLVNGATSAATTLAPLVITESGGLNVALDDLKFPAAFDSLAVVVSRGGEVLGRVFGGGVVSFAGTPGTYQLTLVATPSSTQGFGLYAVSVINAPAPTVTLTSNVASAVSGTSIQLSWTSTNATSCTASGGGFTGTETTNTTTPVSVVLSATTTYTLTCTGAGGSASSSVVVTATSAPGKSGGGGALDLGSLLAALGLLAVRIRRDGRNYVTRL
jgi:hypothetical protein